MRHSLPFALLLIIGAACEIDDDFGKSTLPDAPGEQLASSSDYVSRMFWYQTDKVLLHNGYLSLLDISDRSIGMASQEYFQEVAGVTTSGKAICFYYQNDSNLALRAIDLEGGESVTLAQNVYFDYYLRSGAVISGDDVFYTEVDTDWRQFVYRHNVVTNDRWALFEGGVPVAVAPDGSKLLYKSSTQQAVVYDLGEGVHSPAGLLPADLIRVLWTQSGILVYSYIPGTEGGTLEVRDLGTGTVITRQSGIADRQAVFISDDGQRYIYPTARCSNPYYVYNCYDEAAQLAILENDISGREARELARHRFNANESPTALGSGAIAPDGSALIYSVNNGIYRVPLTD